jgi:hypothetical protein
LEQGVDYNEGKQIMTTLIALTGRGGKMMRHTCEQPSLSAERTHNHAEFRLDFQRMLKAFPHTTLLSTNSRATFHLWNERSMFDALTRFIQEGGRIEQFFFVKDLEEATSAETKTMLDLLETAGITLHPMFSSSLSSEGKKHFIIESQEKFGWEIFIDEQGRAGMSHPISDEQAITHYQQIFENLWGNV